MTSGAAGSGADPAVADDGGVVFTLVHGTRPLGTWRPPPTWNQPGGAFAEELRKRFAFRGPVRVHPFDWPGWNRAETRHRAAADLRARLEDQRRRHPGARQVLICHSHGGNVALAAASGDGAPPVDAVVCLATPFLWGRPRALDWGREAIGTGLAVAVFFLAAALLSRWLPVPAAAVAALPILWAVVHVGLRWARSLADLEAMLRPPSIDPERVLVLRAPGDEASLGLAFFQAVSWVSIRLFNGVMRGYDRFEAAAARLSRHKGRLLLSAIAGFAGLYASLMAGAFTTSTGLTWVNAAFVVSLLTVACSVYLIIPALGLFVVTKPVHLLAVALLWPILLAMSILLLLPFGRTIAAANVFLEVFAEATPPGEWTLRLMEPVKDEGGDGGPAEGLRHSLYEHPDVLEHIGVWVEERLAAPPAAPRRSGDLERPSRPADATG